MKLNRSTLRRLIKEELAREVEEAQLDETVGGYGSPEGRAEADENFEAALQTLRDMIAGGRASVADVMTALRAGGKPGDTWHGGLNLDSPDARPRTTGEGVETDEDPLAEAGSIRNPDRSGVIPQETIHTIMDFIGPEKWTSINRDIQKAGGRLEMWNLADALGQYPELVAYLDEMGLLESGTDEGEEKIDEDPVEESDPDLDERDLTYKDVTSIQYGTAPNGPWKSGATVYPSTGDGILNKQSGEKWTPRTGKNPPSLREVLEGRFESLSENMSLEDLDQLGDKLEAAGAPLDMISAIVDDIMNLDFGGVTAASSDNPSSYSAAIADVPGAAKKIEQGQLDDDLINQIAAAAKAIDADMPSSEEMAADLEGSHTPEELAAAREKVKADYPELYQGRGVEYPERYAEGFSNDRLGKLAGILED